MNCEQLISEVFARNALWDQSNPQHHNRTILDSSWDEVAEIMHSTRLSVRTKWKNLRDQFRKELKKQRKRGPVDAGAASVSPTWPYYASMMFIEDQMLPGFPGGDSSIQDSSLKEEQDDSACRKDEPNHLPNRQSPAIRRLSARNRDFNNPKLVELEERKMAQCTNSKLTEDEDYYFFMSLIPHMKHLPPAQKLRVRIQLQELIFHEVYSQEVRGSHPSPSSHGSTSSK